MPLHPLLKKGLHKLGFTKPTEIQKQAIPMAVNGTTVSSEKHDATSDEDMETESAPKRSRDVVGVAETVSRSKTIPICADSSWDFLAFRDPVKPSPTLCPS